MSDVREELSPEEEALADAEFSEGVAMEDPAHKPKAPSTKEEPPRDDSGRFVSPKEENSDAKPGAEKADAKPVDKPDDKPAAPKYVQVTEEQLANLTKAAERTAEFEKQFSKVFGTVGDMQKILRGLQAQTPRGLAVELPPGAFDAMKKDFPELADHMQKAMTDILKGVKGTGSDGAHPDVTDFEAKVEARVLKLAAEDLADEFPDWQKIVGAVDVNKGEKPDPNNPFRKWLATKPQEYQDRINSTNSAGVITRAIRMFKSETKKPAPAPVKPNKQAEVRKSRIEEAVQPKGDGGHPPGKNPDEEFEAGFKSG